MKESNGAAISKMVLPYMVAYLMVVIENAFDEDVQRKAQHFLVVVLTERTEHDAGLRSYLWKVVLSFVNKANVVDGIGYDDSKKDVKVSNEFVQFMVGHAKQVETDSVVDLLQKKLNVVHVEEPTLELSSPLKTAVSTVLRIRAEFLAGTRAHSYVPSDGATEIVDGFLWLGSCYDAEEEDGEWLDDTGITHVLNCATEDVQGNVEGRKYLLLDAQDQQHGYKIIEQHWSAARAFLFDARHTTNAKVLVHCSAGINRSATMVCAYLMASRSIGLVEAATEILKKRPISLCNESFLMQLAELEQKQ